MFRGCYRKKDEHPPEFYRVNASVQQFEEFYDCYGIEEGDGMYLAPEKRIAVW
ncbi:MAG: M13-type metalloendopeptidase [Eubacteriales bacterium]|nr:M13-type metalloendopeptidase [Eubacteriales bacterium]